MRKPGGRRWQFEKERVGKSGLSSWITRECRGNGHWGGNFHGRCPFPGRGRKDIFKKNGKKTTLSRSKDQCLSISDVQALEDLTLTGP